VNEQEKLAALRMVVERQEVHAAHCARVLDKQGRLVPFLWNKAQQFIHARLERQREEIGYVRALVLKGRQQGASTYLGHRFYWQASTRPGRRAFIVAHEDKATSNLFDMVKRYHQHNPLAPSIKASNAKELVFGALDGGYKLATAGTKDVGRSNTAQLLHASEFAFWDNAQAHMAGLGNVVPSGELAGGTEMVLESTANGIGNAFHLMWQAAEAGKGEYIAIFVPWFWQDEYRTPAKPDLDLSQDDVLYQLAYGLTRDQMQWRADKIASYGEGFEWLFDQEYPATAVLAFKSPTKNPLINPSRVMAAVNSTFRDEHAPLIVGCDPAGDGAASEDRTSIVFRRGRMVPRVEYHEGLNTMQVAGKLAGYWNEHQPDAMFIDKTGMGAGIVDRLQELNVPVVGVNAAERANDPLTYENHKAEMWWLMKEWFEDAPCRIPNNAALIADICAPQPDESSNGRKLLEGKKKLAKRGIRSPDGGDALALTFAHPVVRRVGSGNRGQGHTAPTTAGY